MMMMTKNLVMGVFKTCSSRSAATLATSSSKMMIVFFSTTADSPLPLLASTTTPITTGKSLCRCPHHLSLVWNRCPRHLSLDWEPNIRPLSPHLVKLMSVFEFPAYNLRITEDESFKAELNSIGSLHASAFSAHFASMRKKHNWEHICSFFLEWISLNPDHTDIKLFNSYLLSAIMLGDSMASVMNFVVEMEGYIGSSAKTYGYLFQTLFERGGVGFDEIFCSDMNVWGEIELQEIVNGLINTQVYNSLGISIVLIFIIVGIGFKLSPDVKMQKKGHLINNTSFTCILDASLKRNEIDFASKLIEDGSESGCKISLGTFIELVRVSVMQNMVDSLVSYSEKLKVHSYLRGADSPPWWLCNYMIGVALVVKNNKLACIASDFMNSKIDEEGKSFFYFVDREKLESLIVLACNTSDPKLLYCSWKLLKHSST